MNTHREGHRLVCAHGQISCRTWTRAVPILILKPAVTILLICLLV